MMYNYITEQKGEIYGYFRGKVMKIGKTGKIATIAVVALSANTISAQEFNTSRNHQAGKTVFQENTGSVFLSTQDTERENADNSQLTPVGLVTEKESTETADNSNNSKKKGFFASIFDNVMKLIGDDQKSSNENKSREEYLSDSTSGITEKDRLRKIKFDIIGTEKASITLDRTIAILKSRNIAVSDSDKSFAEKVRGEIKNINDAETLNPSTINSIKNLENESEKLKEVGLRLLEVERLPKILNEAQAQTRKLSKDLTKVSAKQKNSGIDTSKELSILEVSIDSINNSISSLQSNLEDNDLDSPMEYIENEIFAKIEDVEFELFAIDNLPKGSNILKITTKEIYKLGKKEEKLRKIGMETKELDFIVGEMIDKQDEIKKELEGNNFNFGNLIDCIKDFNELKRNATKESLRLESKRSDIRVKYSSPLENNFSFISVSY